jgi:predicted TIM-barrel enzyme
MVHLYLPALPAAAEYDEKAAEALARNLIYVAIPRAMDDLNVFVGEGAKESAITALVGAANGVTRASTG